MIDGRAEHHGLCRSLPGNFRSRTPAGVSRRSPRPCVSKNLNCADSTIVWLKCFVYDFCQPNSQKKWRNRFLFMKDRLSKIWRFNQHFICITILLERAFPAAQWSRKTSDEGRPSVGWHWAGLHPTSCAKCATVSTADWWRCVYSCVRILQPGRIMSKSQSTHVSVCYDCRKLNPASLFVCYDCKKYSHLFCL